MKDLLFCPELFKQIWNIRWRRRSPESTFNRIHDIKTIEGSVLFKRNPYTEIVAILEERSRRGGMLYYYTIKEWGGEYTPIWSSGWKGENSSLRETFSEILDTVFKRCGYLPERNIQYQDSGYLRGAATGQLFER